MQVHHISMRNFQSCLHLFANNRQHQAVQQLCVFLTTQKCIAGGLGDTVEESSNDGLALQMWQALIRLARVPVTAAPMLGMSVSVVQGQH